MYKIQVKVFEVAKGELPGTSRKVLGWGEHCTIKKVEYHKDLRKFFWGYVFCSVEYWMELKQLEAINGSKSKG